MKIYAIFTGTGDYEDYKEQPLKGFVNKARAEKELKKLIDLDKKGKEAFRVICENVTKIRGRYAGPNQEDLKKYSSLFRNLAGFEYEEWKNLCYVMYEIDIETE